MESNYVIGLDFGTDSVRAVLVNTQSGQTLQTSVHHYQRWKKGLYCDASTSRFRQHILDHTEGMEATISSVLKDSRIGPGAVSAICVDTTGSSPVPVDSKGTALCMLPGFEEDPDAMMVLWKDHTSIREAEEINHLARTWGGTDYTKYEGGIYSSEWFWAKILHICRTNEKIKEAAFSWMEHCDLMTYILTGGNNLSSFRRSRCAAGHKAMWHESWGGLPADEFLRHLDPSFVELKKNLYSDTFTSDQPAGRLSSEWAERTGLTENTIIAVGTFDAHAGAVGAEVEEFTLVRVMGTSTCDIIVSREATIGTNTVEGICGQVNGSVIPGMIGLEAGQSAFGDYLAWFRDVLAWPIDRLPDLSDTEKEILKESLIEELSAEAEKTPLSLSVPVALDWINGRRTPDANQELKAAIMNLNLGTGAPEIFRSLVEAICFGSRKIVERFREQGVEIKEVVGIGGVAKKSSFIMQTLADVLDMPIKIATSEQAPALGAAMYAATAAGIYPTVHEAIKNMSNGFDTTYFPKTENTRIYNELYQTYHRLGSFVESETKNNVKI
ncbi:ribulokinase [Fulvivirga sedimenti]|uniref:Ribulokinase n=1 Tax=Fulvivirga sedimenti TaxID=2879465 RepID=A0A9X1L1X8_9BACT|nr:ribulokinase [Fulvivirga sedimenti]MCA6078707.1 ribulokinase [Fulvivirga sedimenti]